MLTFSFIGYRYGNCVGSLLFVVRVIYTSVDRVDRVDGGTAVYFVRSSQFTFDNSVVARRRSTVEVWTHDHCVRNVFETFGLLFVEGWTAVEIININQLWSNTASFLEIMTQF